MYDEGREDLQDALIAQLFARSQGPSTSGVAASVADAAALTALPTAPLLLGAFAYVATYGAYFALQPASALVPDRVLASSSSSFVWVRVLSAVAITSQQQTLWYVDRQNSQGTSSNENDGKSESTALLDKNEINRRWGTNSPDLSTSQFTIHYLSADTTPGDTGNFTPNLKGGALLTHIAALPAPSFVGTLNSVTPKVSDTAPGNALEVTFTTSSGVVVPNMILVNPTRGNSRAPAQRILSGSTWQIGQPFAPYIDGTLPVAVEINTWAHGDAILGYIPLSIDLGNLGGKATGINQSSFGPSHVLRQMTVACPGSTFEGVYVDLGCNFLAVDCVFERALSGHGEPIPAIFQVIMGCVQIEQVIAGAQSMQFAGGIVAAGGQFYSAAFKYNVIIGGGLIAFDADLDDSEVFLDDGVVFIACGHTFLAGATVPAHIYGRGIYNQESGESEYHETAAVHFLCGVQISGSSQAYANTTTGSSVAVTRITLSGSAIDLAGGLAYIGGSSIHATSAAP